MERHWALGIISLIFSILCLVTFVGLALLVMALPLLMIYVFRITMSYNTEATILLLWNGILLLIGVALKKKIKKRW